MDKLDGMSLDIESVEKEKLKSIFPQCFVEGKLDVQKLLDLCGEYEIKDFERYEFTWHGKSECLKNAQTRSHGTLRPCVEESKNFDETQNLYIEGDNLEVLKLLQNSYYNKVKMIYIDPPYNTGKDFIYKDNFKDSIANYKEITSQATKSNAESMGRFHTDWLNMIYPRLRLAYNLLRDDGVIFISIDDNEVHNLRKVCDEVFGEENFVAKLVWQSTPGSNTGTNIITVTEYILVYAKSKANCLFNTLPISDEEKYVLEDEYVAKRGKYILNKLDRRMTGPHYSEALNYPIEMPDGKHIYPGSTEHRNNENWNYRWSKTKVDWGIENGFIVFKNIGDSWNTYFKQYLKVDNNDNKIVRSLPYQNLIKLSQFNSTQGTKEIMSFFGNKFFDYPKPSNLIKYLVNICLEEDAVILDFFSGSATTAHAVMDLNKEDGGNRKFILVQLPELCDENTEAYKNGYKNICEIGKERIRRAGAKIEEEIKEHNEQLKLDEKVKENIDTGFKVFKLDTSNVKIWDNTPIENVEEIEQLDMLTKRLNTMVETVKEDRTDLDLVYEVLLKMGIELTESIIPHEFGGSLDNPTSKSKIYEQGSLDNPTSKKGYIVREDALLIVCLDKEVKAEHVAEMIEYAPSTIVFAEDSFESLEEIENAKIQVNEKLGYEFGEKVKFRFV